MVDEDRHYTDDSSGGFTATVLSTPGSESTGLRVRVHAFSSRNDRSGVVDEVRWQPRYTVGSETVQITYPTKGDHALIVYDEEGGAWAPVWWPRSF